VTGFGSTIIPAPGASAKPSMARMTSSASRALAKCVRS
jgi:hypothetical protein